MTNTKFRKRALLSSVAMLLVALVALGSATFAWFVDDPTANAKGIQAKAQASTGLLISTDSTPTFVKSADLGKDNSTAIDITLSPAGTVAAANSWGYVKGKSFTDGTHEDNAKWTSMTPVHHDDDAGVYYEDITLKRTGTIETGYEAVLKVSKVEIGFTNNAIASGATILLVKNGTTPEVVAAFTKDNAKPAQFASVANGTDYANPVAAASNTFTTKSFLTSQDSTDSYTAFEVGRFAAGTDSTLGYKLYIYLDGEDSNVTSEKATSASSVITFCNLYFSVEEPTLVS